MIHSKKGNLTYRKPISDINKSFPDGFKNLSFRILPDRVKSQIILHKITEMGTSEFRDICSLLNFTPNDIQQEKRQLREYQTTLNLKIKNAPPQPKKRTKRIKQQEFDTLQPQNNFFTKSLDKEYSRIFPLLVQMIEKIYHVKELQKIYSENGRIAFNLETVMENDLRTLHNSWKELALELRSKKKFVSATIQEKQSKIKKLKSYIVAYANRVYTPLIDEYDNIRHEANAKLEPFFFNVVDSINEKMEKIRIKHPSHMKEFYFDDGFELHAIVNRKPPSKYPVKVLRFTDLSTELKRKVIQILKTQL